MSQATLQHAIAAFQGGDLDRAQSIGESLAAHSSSGQLYHLLGLIHCRRGSFTAGADHFRKAANAEPGNAAHRLMLCRALIDGGQPAEVLAMSEPARDGGPESMALWHARAEAALAVPDYAVAAEAWSFITAARRSDWRAWANLGQAMAGLERWQEAADALGKASALNRQEFPLRQNYASALVHAGFYAEAADELRAMLDDGHDDVGTRLTLSRLLADLGRHQESMAELDKVAQLTTGAGASGQDNARLIRIVLKGGHRSDEPVTGDELQDLRELALLLERTNRIEALRLLLADAEQLGLSREQLGYPAAAVALRDGDAAEAKRLLEHEPPDEDPVRRYRLLAKIHDSLGEPEAAFEAANRMHRSVPEYDSWVRHAAEYRRRIRALGQAATAEWATQLQPLQSGARRSPSFLVGFPRSGTTLLDTFLMGHPSAQVAEEFPMLRVAEALLGKMTKVPGSDLLDQARQAYFAELDRHIDPEFSGLVIDKMPLNMLRLSLIHVLFPDAKVIFAQRHPCDAVLSGFMQSFTLNDAMACFLTIEDAADLYDSAMNLFCASRAMLPLAVHSLVYEQLVADPEAALRPLLEFLGLDWRDEVLNHQATAARRGAIITPSYDQVVQPLTNRPVNRWRRYEKQLEPVLPVLLPWAERLGYSG